MCHCTASPSGGTAAQQGSPPAASQQHSRLVCKHGARQRQRDEGQHRDCGVGRKGSGHRSGGRKAVLCEEQRTQNTEHRKHTHTHTHTHTHVFKSPPEVKLTPKNFEALSRLTSICRRGAAAVQAQHTSGTGGRVAAPGQGRQAGKHWARAAASSEACCGAAHLQEERANHKASQHHLHKQSR